MNSLIYVLIALRSAALAITLVGRPRSGDTLYAIADAIEAGRVTDAHMKAVAEKLKSRAITDEDWDDVLARIERDAARLHEEE